MRARSLPVAFRCFALFVLALAACNLPRSGDISDANAPRPDSAASEPAPLGAASPSPAEFSACSGGDNTVALLVDPRLLDGIRTKLSRFEADLCLDEYTVIERRADFPSPPDVRAYLGELYASTQQKLMGAILIGDIPHAYQYLRLTYANPNIPPSTEEVISFQYYSDLNGVFRTSDGYLSPGGHSYSYDVHEGEMNWEIWVGVLPLYKGDIRRTIEAINRYFDKNHDYRTGGYTIPRAFMQVDEHYVPSNQAEEDQMLGWLRDGEYAWTPFSNAPGAHIYFNSFSGTVNTIQGYTALSQGTADFVNLSAHGSYRASGWIDIAWVQRNPVATVFLWSDGCAVGNLDYSDNFLTAVLYDPGSMVLVAKGTTNDSGGMGTNANGFYGHNIATALSRGSSFGEAILYHVNVPLGAAWASFRELHFGTPITLGDPTLTLRPE